MFVVYMLIRLGVELNERFPLSDYLKSADITPGGLYSYDSVLEAVRRRLGGKNPAVQCEYDREARRHALAQVRHDTSDRESLPPTTAQ